MSVVPFKTRKARLEDEMSVIAERIGSHKFQPFCMRIEEDGTTTLSGESLRDMLMCERLSGLQEALRLIAKAKASPKIQKPLIYRIERRAKIRHNLYQLACEAAK